MIRLKRRFFFAATIPLFVVSLLLAFPTVHAEERAAQAPEPKKETENVLKQDSDGKVDPSFSDFFAAEQPEVAAATDATLVSPPARAAATRTRAVEGRRVSHTRTAILSRLSRKTSASWDEESLSEVMQAIAQAGDVNIILHPEADPDKTITLTVNDMSVKQVLNWVMRLSDYGCEIRDEAILIGPKDKIKGQLVLRIYSVADLTRRKKNFYPPNADDDDDDDEEEEDEGENSIDLSEMVRKIVAPDSWDE